MCLTFFYSRPEKYLALVRGPGGKAWKITIRQISFNDQHLSICRTIINVAFSKMGLAFLGLFRALENCFCGLESP